MNDNPWPLTYYRGPKQADRLMHEGEWTPKLNRYQRDNLMCVFAVAGYALDAKTSIRSVWPFTMLQTGDWLGEISQMLAKPTPGGTTYTLDDHDRPNLWPHMLEDRVILELTLRLHKATTTEPLTPGLLGCEADGHSETARMVVFGHSK